MAYDVSALNNYTKENEDLLVMKSLFGARTQQIIQAEGTVMTGVKSAETINILDTDATFQTGGTCGFLSSGTTAITQRTLTIGKIKVNESLCPKTLETKYTQKALQIGSRYENIPFEQEYTDLKAGTIAEQLEIALWQGNTAHGSTNLNKFDGFIKLIDTAAVAVAANSATYISGGAVSGAITTANVKSIVNAMWLALPARVQGKKDVRVFCGWDTFQKFVAAYTDQNLFHYAPKGSEVSQENGEVIIPGTFYKLTAVHGLDGTNRLFAMRTSNMYFGTDLENEEERWEIFFAKEADEVRFVVEWKAGVQIAFPNEIVQFTLA
jgi:hypothetical protein